MKTKTTVKSFGVTWMNLLQKIASRLHPVFWLMVIKITDPLEIANSFNNFFISIVQTYISSTENTRDRHVYDSVYNFLIKKSLLYLAQSVFRAIHFCETSLNRLVDMWTSNMEKDLLILDLRKRLTWSILTFSSRNCLYTNVTKTLLTG